MKCEVFAGGTGSSYDLNGYDFRIVFGTNEDGYLRVPILSLMRNSEETESQCNLLVYYLNV